MAIERSLHYGQGRNNQRTPMEKDRTIIAKIKAFSERWTTASGQSGMLQRNSVGTSERCSMERSAQTFSIAQHVLASIARLGRTRRMGTGMDCTDPRTGRTGPTQLDEYFCRWNVCSGKKRGLCVGKTKRGKGTKLMVVASGEGIPLGVYVASATPHEIKLIEPTLDKTALLKNHEGYLVADRAYDSDPLRDRLAQRGLELICPHKINRCKPKRQDGRKLRRYRHRWIIERTIAWLQNYRRVAVRWDRKVDIYRAFVHLACVMILLNRF